MTRSQPSSLLYHDTMPCITTQCLVSRHSFPQLNHCLSRYNLNCIVTCSLANCTPKLLCHDTISHYIVTQFPQSFKPPQPRYKNCIVTRLSPPGQASLLDHHVTIQFTLYRDTIGQWPNSSFCTFSFFSFSHTYYFFFHFFYWKTPKNICTYFFFSFSRTLK